MVTTKTALQITTYHPVPIHLKLNFRAQSGAQQANSQCYGMVWK